MPRLIDADALIEKAYWHGEHPSVDDLFAEGVDAVDVSDIDNAPTIEAEPVVRCEKCVLHGNCTTEDVFLLAGIEHPFCCAGKQKEGAD